MAHPKSRVACRACTGRGIYRPSFWRGIAGGQGETYSLPTTLTHISHAGEGEPAPPADMRGSPATGSGDLQRAHLSTLRGREDWGARANCAARQGSNLRQTGHVGSV